MHPYANLKKYVKASPILVLSFIPFDMATSLLWYIGFFYFFMGVLGVCKFLFTKKVLSFPHTAIAQVIFFPIAVGMVYASFKVAENYALQVSHSINESCNNGQKCPTDVVGWSKDKYGRINTKSGFSAKYWLVYKPSENLQSFELKVIQSIDHALFFYGGVNERVRNIK